MIKKMRLIKIAAIVFFIIITGPISVYLIIKNSSPIVVAPENNLTENGSEKPLFKIPSRSTQNNITQPNESAQEEIQQPQIFSEIESKVQNFFDFTKIPSQPNLASENQSLIGEYYKNFLNTLIKVNFTKEELASVKKDNDNRVLLLEELIEQTLNGEKLDSLQSSFAAWHQLDERVLTELNKISVKPEIFHIHQDMTDWFRYHSDTAKKLSEGNLSQNQIIQLADEFKTRAKIHTSKFGESLSQLKNSSDFVSIPKAQAITCGAVVPPPFYHFGGRVALMMPCDWGIVNTISLPCGGLLLFSYPVLAANPYLWKKPTIGAAVLGRSLLLPGCCCLGGCMAGCIPFEAVVLYFGTSLIP